MDKNELVSQAEIEIANILAQLDKEIGMTFESINIMECLDTSDVTNEIVIKPLTGYEWVQPIRLRAGRDRTT